MNMQYKAFVLDEIFEKIPVGKITGKANDFPTIPTEEYTIPLRTASAENQGLSRYAKPSQCPSILSNVISVSANGTAISYFHDKPFAILQDAYAIDLRNGKIPNHQVGLYLVTCLNKLLYGNFDWSNKAGWNNIRHLKISLPVVTHLIPDWEQLTVIAGGGGRS